MIRIHYQVGNGYNSSAQIVTYILQKAFFKHVLEVGISSMSDFRKYLNKQLDNKEFKKEWDNSKNKYDLAKSQVAARKEDVTWKSKAY